MRHLARPVVVSASVLVAVLIALVVIVVARGETAAGPPWMGKLSECRANPIMHVHDPSRLKVLKSCATVSGHVKRVEFVSAYDDFKITLVPDRKTRSYLPSANKGVLVADIIATDQVNVAAPEVGSDITAWGAWALDKATNTTMLLPAYRIVVDQSGKSIVKGHSVENHGPPVQRKLTLSLSASSRVVVGGRIDVGIRAGWSQYGAILPASQIRLFAEMSTGDRVGVRWKAAMTDTRGVATLHLVAIQVPADYTLTVYATPSRIPVTAQALIHIAKK